MKRGLCKVATVLTLLLSARSVFAEPLADRAQLIHGDNDDFISALHWEGEEFSVEEKLDKSGAPFLVALIEGRMEAPGWNLVTGKQWLVKPADPESNFVIEVPLKGDTTPLRLSAFNLSGEFEEESLEIRFDGWMSWKKSVEERKAAEEFKQKRDDYWKNLKRLYVNPMLGYSMINYTETNVTPFSTTALTPALGLQFLIVPNLSLSASGFINALSLGASRTDVSVYFWGADAGIGWGIPIGSWRLNLTAGWYLKTMNVSNNLFGYQTMLGPQFFPSLEKSWGGHHTGSIYFKFSPTTDGVTFFPFTDRELAAGVGYRYRLASGGEIPVTLDASWVHLEFTRAIIDNTALTLNVGYVF